MSKIKIILNGEDYLAEKNQTIDNLILKLNLDISKIAIEKNLQIIPPEEFALSTIKENDKIEIVSFIGGG
jgi:thiamine biosynthesis protein ThiS